MATKKSVEAAISAVQVACGKNPTVKAVAVKDFSVGYVEGELAAENDDYGWYEIILEGAKATIESEQSMEMFREKLEKEAELNTERADLAALIESLFETQAELEVLPDADLVQVPPPVSTSKTFKR